MRWFSMSHRQAPGRDPHPPGPDALAVPDALPVLSAGRHRTPRTGACFMEWASLLAGEKFSDHPSCTHPLLGHLARMVNDATTDTGRRRLAPLIPSVVGLTSEDPRWDDDVAVAAALVALPVAQEEDRRALAAGVLTCERLRALHRPVHADRRADGYADGKADGEDPYDGIRPATRAALAGTPRATAWALDFTAGLVRLQSLRDPASALTEHAVLSVVRLGRDDTDELLARMLRDAIAAVRGEEGAHRAPAQALPTRTVTAG